MATPEEKGHLEEIRVGAETKRADIFSSLSILDKTQ
jgi:hypothetical protein